MTVRPLNAEDLVWSVTEFPDRWRVHVSVARISTIHAVRYLDTLNVHVSADPAAIKANLLPELLPTLQTQLESLAANLSPYLATDPNHKSEILNHKFP